MVITRYVFKTLLGVTGFVTLVLTLLIMLTQSLRFLELIVETGAPLGNFFQLIVLATPRFLEVILPLSLVTAILFIYNKMIMDNEMIVLRACGFNQWALMRPALILAGSAFAVLLFLTMWGSPVSHAKMEQMRDVIKTQYASLLLREGVFNDVTDGLMVYMDHRLDNGDMVGLLIHDTRETPAPPVTVVAKRGHMVRQSGDTVEIVVFNGKRQQYNPETGTLGILNFSEYSLEVSNLKSDVRLQWKKPDERTIFELLSPDESNPRDVKSMNKFSAEVHKRILAPLTVFDFAFIGLAALLAGSFNRRGQSRRIIIAAAAVILLESLYISLANAIETKAWAIPVYYAAVILPIGFCIALLTPAAGKIQTLLPGKGGK